MIDNLGYNDSQLMIFGKWLSIMIFGWWLIIDSLGYDNFCNDSQYMTVDR